MLALLPWVLFVISPAGVGMQEFNDLDACKKAMSAVGYDQTAHKFRNVETFCLPKGSPEVKPASAVASAPQ